MEHQPFLFKYYKPIMSVLTVIVVTWFVHLLISDFKMERRNRVYRSTLKIGDTTVLHFYEYKNKDYNAKVLKVSKDSVILEVKLPKYTVFPR